MGDGVVRDFFACVHLLRVLVAASAPPCGDACSVLVGVPATATLRQKNRLVAAVRRGVGGRVTTVEEPLAAALACRPDRPAATWSPWISGSAVPRWPASATAA